MISSLKVFISSLGMCKCVVYRVRRSKSSYLYENLPVHTRMAILSRRLIILAILVYELQNYLSSNMQF